MIAHQRQGPAQMVTHPEQAPKQTNVNRKHSIPDRPAYRCGACTLPAAEGVEATVFRLCDECQASLGDESLRPVTLARLAATRQGEPAGAQR